jgi:hypothetical protein
MNEFYTYFHTRNDTGVVFYVGKGRGSRCHGTKDRNCHWKRIVAKHGHTVHKAMTHLTEQEAFSHEKFLILRFKEMGIQLCNMTDGGEGYCGGVPSAETRAKLSAAGQGNKNGVGYKPSAEKIEQSRMLMLGNKYRLGITHTPEARASISAKLSVLMIGNTRGKGHKFSEKMMTAMIGNQFALGSKWSAERRAQRAQYRHSPETRAKMSRAHVGNKNALGHKDTPEQTAKRSAVQKARRAREKDSLAA